MSGSTKTAVTVGAVVVGAWVLVPQVRYYGGLMLLALGLPDSIVAPLVHLQMPGPAPPPNPRVVGIAPL